MTKTATSVAYIVNENDPFQYQDKIQLVCFQSVAALIFSPM